MKNAKGMLDAEAGAEPLYLRTLGALELYAEEAESEPLLRGVKPLLVPAVLSTLPGFSAERTYLADLIWAGSEPARRKASLRQALHHLTKFGRGGGVQADNGRILLDADSIRIDLWDFEEAIRRRDYEGAVGLHRGRFCEGLEGRVHGELARWIEAQNDRTQVAIEAAYSELIAERLGSGAYAEALRFAQDFAGANPLSDNAQLAFIRTLRAGGQDIRALQVYEGFRSLLESELGGRLDEASEVALARLKGEVTGAPEPTRVVFVDGSSATGEPTAGAGASPRRIGPVGAVGLSVLVVGLLAIGANALRTSLAGGTSGAPEASFSVNLGDSWGRVIWRNRALHFDRRTLQPGGLRAVSPDRRTTAFLVHAPDGENLAIMRQGTVDTVVLTHGALDEEPMAWSPDSKRILFAQGRLEPGPEHRHVWLPRIIDVETGEITEVAGIELRNRVGAWSPDGTRMAIQGVGDTGTGRIVIATPDGRSIRWVTPDSLDAHRPAWSRDSRMIAFDVASDNGSRVLVVDAEGKSLREVTVGFPNALTPVWLSDRLVAFVTDVGDQARIQVVDAYSDAPVTGIEVPAGTTILGRTALWKDQGWVDAIRITAVDTLVGPGQWIQLRETVSTNVGRVVEAEPELLRWSSSDSSVVSVSQSGMAHVLSEGDARIRVDLAGWRHAELPLRSRVLQMASPPIALEEDWTEGLRRDAWIPYGMPAPYVERSGAPGGGFLVSNGDAHFTSGVVSVRAFPLRRGLTLEFVADVPITSVHYQDLGFGFVDTIPPADTVLPVWEERRLPTYRIAGLPTRISAFGVSPSSSSGPPFAVPPGWHTYALQYGSDGLVSLVIDGRLIERIPPAEPWNPDMEVHVILYGSSLDTQIKYGPVRVYEAERYGLER